MIIINKFFISSIFTFPVVWCKPKLILNSSSEQAYGASILLPRIRNGTFNNSSIVRRAYRIKKR